MVLLTAVFFYLQTLIPGGNGLLIPEMIAEERREQQRRNRAARNLARNNALLQMQAQNHVGGSEFAPSGNFPFIILIRHVDLSHIKRSFHH